MKNFQFWNPTRIIFGKDSIKEIGKELSRYNAKKTLLIYGGGSIKKNNVYTQTIDSLTKYGVEYIEFSGIKPNPRLSRVREAITICRSNDVDALLAVGGGSVIDTAKAVAAGLEYTGEVWDLFTGNGFIEEALPIFTILTISGTSSEMNMVTVITNEETNEKFGFASAAIYPDVSIIDPEAQFTVPEDYVAYGSIDAISHLLEVYFNGEELELSIQDNMTVCLLKTIMETTESVLKEPKNYKVRANLAWAITLSFNGLSSAGRGIHDFPCHTLEHSLSALYDIPHGAGLSIMLPAWMSWALKEQPARFANFAYHLFGINDKNLQRQAEEGIASLKTWFKSIGGPVSLKEHSIDIERDCDRMIENMCMHLRNSRLAQLLTPKVIKEILVLAR